MNSSQFKRNEFKRFCSILCIKPEEVERIAKNIDKFYLEWVKKKIDEKTGLPKTFLDGSEKTRIIRPSQNELKLVQSRIKNKILASIPLPTAIHGGLRGKSNITNAKAHQGKKYVFTTDLQNFYPSITSIRVYRAFCSLDFSPHFSHWLTKLTTWKHELPQGTPTSTHIANLVFLETDLSLIKLCKENNITYTRYVDDLTFSSQKDFRYLLPEILKILSDSNFEINYRKTKYHGNQTITGVNVFLNKIDAPKRIIEKSEAEIAANQPLKHYTNYLNNIRKTNK